MADSEGWSPLWGAVVNQKRKMVEVLVMQGADVLWKKDGLGYTVLSMAQAREQDIQDAIDQGDARVGKEELEVAREIVNTLRSVF